MAGPDHAGIRDVSQVNDSLGCLDLPIKNARVEPAYYRLYYKLKSNLFC